MSPHATPRRLQRGHVQRTPVGQGVATPMTSREQPADRAHIVLEQVLSGLFASVVRARHEAHLVTDGLKLGLDGSRSQTGRREQRDTHRVEHGPGFRAHGHHIPREHRGNGAPPHERVLLHESASTLQGIGEQHGLHTRIAATGELPQERQQSVESIGITSQSIQEARIGRLAHIEHTSRRRDGREPIADGVRQTAQQIVMNGEPVLRATRLPGLATH
jgi:hypothetical protein